MLSKRLNKPEKNKLNLLLKLKLPKKKQQRFNNKKQN